MARPKQRTAALFSLALTLLLTVPLLAGCFGRGEPDQAVMLAAMFPERSFEAVEGVDGAYRDQDGWTFIIDQVVPGSYTTAGADELLMIVTQPEDELAHAMGFYQAYLAVFDRRGGLLTQVNHFTADEGAIAFFAAGDRDYVFFAGSVTFQGWTEWQGGLWRAGGVSGAWVREWPENPETFWTDRAVEITAAGLRVLERKELPPEPGQSHPLIPTSVYEYAYTLRWDEATATFVQDN